MVAVRNMYLMYIILLAVLKFCLPETER